MCVYIHIPFNPWQGTYHISLVIQSGPRIQLCQAASGDLEGIRFDFGPGSGSLGAGPIRNGESNGKENGK